MRKPRLIDLLAFLWQLTRLDDPENAEFGRELLGAVIGDIHEKIGIRPETLWDVARRLGEQQRAGLRFSFRPFAPGYYGSIDCTPLFEKFGHLDDGGFTAELIAHIIEQFPAFKHVWGSGAGQALLAGKGAKRKRRRASSRKPRPLTDRQRDALDLLARHGNDVEAAAEEWGISRQAMSKLRNRAREKLRAAGQMNHAEMVATPTGPKAKRPQRLPQDRRGQETLADPHARNPLDSDD
jgi:DNA-binding CsgD family transcriptional regulator